MNIFLSWDYTLDIYKIRSGLYMVNPIEYIGEKESKSEIIKKHLIINEDGFNVINLINGANTYTEIVHSLKNIYNETDSVIDDNIKMCVSLMNSMEVNLNLKEIPSDNSINIVDSIYPKVATLELTTKCNMKCLHYYGKYEAEKKCR